MHGGYWTEHDFGPVHCGRVLVGSPGGRELRALVSGRLSQDRMHLLDQHGYSYGTVQSCKLDGSDVQTVIPTGAVYTPTQLIIDQETTSYTSAIERERKR
jgi:hypothetical protein